jgi:hypothetical protein
MSLHVLVDFENVQPTFEEVAKLAPGLSEVWLFHGPHQIKLAGQFKGAHAGVTPVPISKTGKNALDFHLSFYLGYVAAKNPNGRLMVIANDKGYDPMIVHAKALGFETKRVGFKVKKTVATKRVAAAKKIPTAKVSAPVKQKVLAKKAKPAKVAVAKKVATTKAATAKKIPVQQQISNLSPARLPAARIAKGLAKMGDKRPEKLKSLVRHIESMLGKDATPAVGQEMIQQLERAGVLKLSGDKVVYT